MARPKIAHGSTFKGLRWNDTRSGGEGNELRPQDVIRILVHVQAYGDAGLVPGLVEAHKARLITQIDEEERQEIERLNAFYEPFQQRLDKIDADIALQERKLDVARSKGERSKIERAIAKLESQRKGPVAKINERDDKIAEAQRKAENDREQVIATGKKLIVLYDGPDQLLKHTRVVDAEDIEENEYNLNVPRYVDTFEPEPCPSVEDALAVLNEAERSLRDQEAVLRELLDRIGYRATAA